MTNKSHSGGMFNSLFISEKFIKDSDLFEKWIGFSVGKNLIKAHDGRHIIFNTKQIPNRGEQ